MAGILLVHPCNICALLAVGAREAYTSSDTWGIVLIDQEGLGYFFLYLWRTCRWILMVLILGGFRWHFRLMGLLGTELMLDNWLGDFSL